jgi:M6 family metalloprotease-like protein
VVHYTETVDGYTLIRTAGGGYEYAEMSRAGALSATGIPAHNPGERSGPEKSLVRRLEKHLRHTEDHRKVLIENFRSQPEYIAHRNAERFPATGEHRVLVILIQYPDLVNQHSSMAFDALMNEEGYNGTGSFRDYFLKNSFGQLDVEADVFGWYTSVENHDYYGFQNGFQRSRELMAEAIDAAEAAGVDFSQYDNDNDGQVDAVIGIHAGPGAEVGAQTQYIWSHRWTLGANYERSYDGVVISDYMINPETRPWGMVGVGVFCHEFGHVLGLPDLYDTDNSSSGIGNWGLMSKGAWLNLERTPANMNAWSKYANDWIDPEVITSGAFSLESADAHAACYRINTADPDEYFLLENRQPTGNDTYLPGSGLAIWHIDESRTSMYPGSNNVNADEENKGVDLEEADGLFELDSGPFNGDGGDLFPGSGLNTTFNQLSHPSSGLNSGAPTDISITNIRELNGQIFFRLNDEMSCTVLNAVAAMPYNCGDGTYDQEIIVSYEFEPLSGELSVNGRSFPITGSPQVIVLEDLPANGQVHDLHVAFTDDLSCEMVTSDAFTAPQAYLQQVEQTTCDPAAAGLQILHLASAAGCDSTVTLVTTLLPSYDITIHQATCSFDLAGTYISNFVTAGGCDSTVTQIFEYLVPDTLVVQATTCIPGEAGEEVFHYVTAGGCDSIVRIETLLLANYNNTVISYTCDPAEAGVIVQQWETAEGCDSTVVVETRLAPAYEIEVAETACEPGLPAEETVYLDSQYGCDSIVHISRTFGGVSAAFESRPQGQAVAFTNLSGNGVHSLWLFGDGSLSMDEHPVHRFGAPGIYQVWLMAWTDNCSTPQLYHEFVHVKAEAAPVTELTEQEITRPMLHMYPNPSFGHLTVEADGFREDNARITLFDMHGVQVLSERAFTGSGTRDLDLGGIAPGIYVLQIDDGDKAVAGKLILTN